jgi:hypothetical protein
VRSEEAFGDLAQRDEQRRGESEELGRRLVDVEAALAAAREGLDGALEQDRITAGIVADAESRLADELADLRQRLRKLADERQADHEGDEASSNDREGEP